jgi:glycosyltransferase involved in cell wall biosynthesis
VSRISVTIITFNEATNIRECLESVAWADEIVVVDSESRDETVTIAREYTDQVFVNPWPGHQEQKNVAVDKATGPWIFSLDADERVTPELAEEIRRVAANPGALDGYDVARKNYFLGRWMRHGGWWPDRVVRLFRKDRGRFGGINPHDRVIIQGRMGSLTPPLIHHTYRTFKQYVHKQYSYAEIGAREMLKRRPGRRITVASMIAKGLTKFMEVYVLKRGALDGVHGLIAAVCGSYFAFLRYALVWEAKRNTQRDASGGSPLQG